MPENDTIIKEFRTDPLDFVFKLIAGRNLRGEMRRFLASYILENYSDPLLKDVFWLPLMPWYASVDFTGGFCNLKCRMCGGSSGKLKYLSTSNMETILEHVPTIGNVAFPAADSDPLLNPELPDILQLVKDWAMPLNIVCNGFMLKGKALDAIVRYPYRMTLNVSIDAANPDLYKAIRGVSIDGLLENLMAFKELRKSRDLSNIVFRIMTVGMEDNIQELPDLVRLAADVGAGALILQHMAGTYSPGDFMKNPQWPGFVAVARKAATELNIELTLPFDVPASCSAFSEDGKSRQPEVPVAFAPTGDPAPVICSRFDDIMIQLDGRISQCCQLRGRFMSTHSIYEMPLWRNMEYLKNRMLLLNGGFFKECISAANCQCLLHMPDVQKKEIESGETPPLFS